MHARFLISIGMVFLFASAFANDIDYFAGLKWHDVKDGQAIRLLGVYPSELPENLGAFKILTPENDPTTRHGDLLAHIILDDGGWLQERLVSSGQAIVMPVYETNDTRLQFLRDAEDGARAEGEGLWANPPVVCAAAAETTFDHFSIVQGRVIDAANVRGTIYLNFGEDWRNDFTIRIERKAFRLLPEDMQAALIRLTEDDKPDSVVEARGWVFYSGGPMIDVRSAVQLRFITGFNYLDKGCTP